MGVMSRVRKGLSVLAVVLPLMAGCGGESQETGPSEEPNIGPGGPAGASKADKSPASTPAKTTKEAPKEKSGASK